jgi:hypothetical protein
VRVAKEEYLPELASKISTIHVRGAREVEVVAVDGRAPKRGDVRDLEVMPGAHLVILRQPVRGLFEQRVETAPGGSADIDVPEPVAPAPEPVAAHDEHREPAARPANRPAPVYTERAVSGRGLAVATAALAGAAATGFGVYLLVDANSQAENARRLESATTGPPCLFYGSPACGELLAARQDEAAHRAFGRGFVIAGAALLVAAPVLWFAWPKKVEVSPWTTRSGGGIAVGGVL